jgi:hypothetical protein
LSNFFFISSNNNTSIEHAKISLKFDNFNNGKARISFRTIFTSSTDRGLRLYLLIKNDRNPVEFDKFEHEYNKRLDSEKFLRIAGAYGLELAGVFNRSTVFRIRKLPEREELEGKIAVHPKNVTCRRVSSRNIPQKLKKKIRRKDILLQVEVKKEEVMGILQEISELATESFVWILQFRAFFDNFIPKETLGCWKSTSESWAVEFNLHKERGYEDFIDQLDQVTLQYPLSVELWFTVPHSHLFLASSPVYEKAIRLKSEDLKNKTEDKAGEFESREGDYAVKILNRSCEFAEYSILCVSPFLPEHEPEELRKKIDKFRKESSKFVKWDEIIQNMIAPLTLLVGILALVFGIISVFIVRMAGNTEAVPSLWTLIAGAIFLGFAVWGITFPVHLLLSDRLKPEMRPKDKCFAVSLIAIISMFIVFLFWIIRRS